jgi:hypothetical protein
MRQTISGQAWKSPTTIDGFRQQLVKRMIEGGGSAQRMLAEGKTPKHNPEGLPEWSLYDGTSMAREWRAAELMVANGEALIARGSFEEGSVYLIAGPMFPIGDS